MNGQCSMTNLKKSSKAKANINFILNSKFRPMNYSWGPWHQYSQGLEPYFFVPGSLFIARKRDLMDARYVITSRPYPYEITEREAVDIDSELDFKIARILAEEAHETAAGRSGPSTADEGKDTCVPVRVS